MLGSKLNHVSKGDTGRPESIPAYGSLYSKEQYSANFQSNPTEFCSRIQNVVCKISAILFRTNGVKPARPRDQDCSVVIIAKITARRVSLRHMKQQSSLSGPWLCAAIVLVNSTELLSRVLYRKSRNIMLCKICVRISIWMVIELTNLTNFTMHLFHCLQYTTWTHNIFVPNGVLWDMGRCIV